MFLLAVVIGYTAMILVIFAAQEGLFGGIVYGTTPLPQLLVAGALTFVGAVVGGAVAARIFGRPWFPPAMFLCGLVVLETTYMISTRRLDGPLWFDVLAASSLLVGLLLGAYGTRRRHRNDVATARVGMVQ